MRSLYAEDTAEFSIAWNIHLALTYWRQFYEVQEFEESLESTLELIDEQLEALPPTENGMKIRTLGWALIEAATPKTGNPNAHPVKMRGEMQDYFPEIRVAELVADTGLDYDTAATQATLELGYGKLTPQEKDL